MSRPLRPLIHGATYHVMNRGNRKAVIYHDDRDRKRFLRLLIEAAEEHGVEIQCGTQMGTHFHVIVVTPHANVSDFMQDFEGRYAEYVNWRYGLVGHLFQGPFISVIIENDIQLFTAVWYVFNNPCEAGLCSRFEDWRWSTYAATVGLKPVPRYLSISWVEVLFPAESLEDSQRLLRRCMEEPEPVIAYLQAVDPTTYAAVRSYISERLRTASQPCSFREIMRPPLAQLFPAGQTKIQRDRAIGCAKVVHGYKLSEIAKVLRLNPGSVSRIFRDSRSVEDNSIDVESGI
jgi:putative transposase